MEKIKFKAWDKVNKKIVDVLVIELLNHKLIVGKKTTNTTESYTLNHNDSILIQYIGLKDKNGKEIYEGDIVKIRLTKRIYDNSDCEDYKLEDYFVNDVIIWDNENHRFDTKVVHTKNHNWEEFEVIGNIHQNPKLLKGVGE